MKKASLLLLLIMLCVLTLCILSACASQGKIEKITTVSNLDTVYRYKIKKVQLLKDDESEEVLQETTEFKYSYSNSDLDLYKMISVANEPELQYYFPGLTLKKGEPDGFGNYIYTCKEYNCPVKIMILLDSIDKEYRPSYSINGQLATIEYYNQKTFSNINNTSSVLSKACKEEIDYASYEKILKDYTKEKINLKDNNESTVTLQERYKYYSIVYSLKISLNLNFSPFFVEYHK